MMLVGYSLPAARMFALWCYFLLGIVLWLSARKTFPEVNPFLYLLPPLFLVSDDQHVIHASLVMLELPAILLAMVALLSLNHSLEKPSSSSFFVTSVFSMLCFMTRYSHGVILLGSLGVCYAVLLATSLKGRAWQIGLAWAPALAIMILWLAVLGHWKWLLAYSEVQGGSTVVSTLKGYIFYPRQLLLESSGWLPLLFFLLLIISWIRRMYVPLANVPYLVFFAVGLLALSLRSYNIARFGMVLFPPLWILAAGGAAQLFNDVRKSQWRNGVVAACLILIVFLGVKNLFTLPNRLVFAYENMNTGVDQAYKFISDVVGPISKDEIKLVMYGENDNWNAPALHFYLQSRCMADRVSCRAIVTGEREIRKGWPPRKIPTEEINHRFEDVMVNSDFLVLFAKKPVIQQGWQELASKSFEFARFKNKPQQVQVVIQKKKIEQ